jgi:hypothetical protein
MISPGGQITFDEISEKTGLEKPAVRRLLHHAMAMHILREPEPEVVAHTKISKFLTIPYINGWVNFESRDTWPAITRVSAGFFHVRKRHRNELTHTLRRRL